MKKELWSKTLRGAIFGCAALLAASPAYAYLDPGTGSALIQGLIAAVAAIGVTLKLYWHKFIALFSKSAPSEESGESAVSTAGSEDRPEQ